MYESDMVTEVYHTIHRFIHWIPSLYFNINTTLKNSFTLGGKTLVKCSRLNWDVMTSIPKRSFGGEIKSQCAAMAQRRSIGNSIRHLGGEIAGNTRLKVLGTMMAEASGSSSSSCLLSLSERRQSFRMMQRQLQQQKRRKKRYITRPMAVITTPPSSNVKDGSSLSLDPMADLDGNQELREGAYEQPLVAHQANKDDAEQVSISSVLRPADVTQVADAIVVGCGPAGLALSAELGKRGVNVVLVGHDAPFVNNYGVWVDEFEALGLVETLDKTWQDASCYFDENKEVRVGRAYGRVCRRRLRSILLDRCIEAGVQYLPATVENIVHSDEDPSNIHSEGNRCDSSSNREDILTVEVSDGKQLQGRMVTLASGAAAGRFLKYEEDAPSVAAQTAYGIEVELEGYSEAYDPNVMLFMDYRRHHTGLWDGTARRLIAGQHPNGGDGRWGTESEVPSFLYAMPLENGRVFLEETCLVSKPALPFAVLKRRLERRCRALGLNISRVIEEEWSYIPTGGPLPISNQPITAFGAAANLVHPATGYSIARSLREAPLMAKSITDALEMNTSLLETSEYVWNALWSQEKRRQASFHIFGMELLCRLNLSNTSHFFNTFFALPRKFWQGFLASDLSSVELLAFAMTTFFIAPPVIKAKLVGHLARDPAGKYMIQTYTKKT